MISNEIPRGVPKFEGKNVMEKIQKKVNLWKFQGVMVESIENPGGATPKKSISSTWVYNLFLKKKNLFNETY